MVKGLDFFEKYFAEYTDQYVLIGGAACDIFFPKTMHNLEQQGILTWS
jgi:hypothetical protein